MGNIQKRKRAKRQKSDFGKHEFRFTNHIIAFIILLVLLSTAAYFRNIVWKDEVVLWKDVAKKSVENERGHYNLGNAYSRHGKLEEAIQEYLITLTLNPHYPSVYFNLGNAYYDIGNTYYNQGLMDKAIQMYLTALKYKPNFADAHNNLGNVYYNKRQIDGAMQEYLTALELNINHADAHYNLGLAYRAKGLKNEARKEFEIVLKLKPEYPDVHLAIESLDYHN